MNGVAGYAGAVFNPLLNVAVESTRRALEDLNALPDLWPDFGDRLNSKGPLLSELDDPGQLIRWQPDVRATVLCFEALAGMSFASDPRKGSATLLVYGQRDEVRSAGQANRGGDAPIALVTMSRPTREVLVQQARQVTVSAAQRLQPKSDDVASRDRLSEITSQVSPPFAFWCAALPIHPDLMPRTIELMQLVLNLANFTQQRFKHALALPRPQRFNPKVFPAILTPGHSSLPSGHSTEAFAVANVLYRLLASSAASPAGTQAQPALDGVQRMLMGLAARIANNRQIAGLHTPIDTIAGRMLGSVLSDYLVARCTGAAVHSGRFNGADLMEEAGKLFIDHESANTANLTGLELSEEADNVCRREEESAIRISPALQWLWNKARAEWLAPAADEKPEAAGAGT